MPLPKTWLTEALDWLVSLARHHRAKLTAYVVLIAGFLGTLLALPKALDPFLPPFPNGQEYKRNLLAVGLGLGLPTQVILLFEGLPALTQRRRDRRLIDWGLRGKGESGYFRLTPYERVDRGRFRRADGADAAVLAWLRAEGPAVRYLTGRSGVGKSSLLNASVLPALEEGEPAWLVATARTFGDAAADLAAELRRPGVVYQKPPEDLPEDVLPLLRRVDAYLENQDKRLLIVLDQFEEFLLSHEDAPERREPLVRLLARMEDDPPARIRLLLSMRADYEGDVPGLGLPPLHQGRNWKGIEAFTEPAARSGEAGDGAAAGATLEAAAVGRRGESSPGPAARLWGPRPWPAGGRARSPIGGRRPLRRFPAEARAPGR